MSVRAKSLNRGGRRFGNCGGAVIVERYAAGLMKKFKPMLDPGKGAKSISDMLRIHTQTIQGKTRGKEVLFLMDARHQGVCGDNLDNFVVNGL